MSWPALILKDEALRHNANVMGKYCSENDILIAPHGKSASSVDLWQYQRDAGAWGISVATTQQAGLFIASGVKKLIFANQLVDGFFAQAIQRQMQEDPDLDFYCFIDSIAGIELLESHLDESKRPLGVLIEIGVPGGRAGVRSQVDALAIAQRLVKSHTLHLAGIAAYEGSVSNLRTDSALLDVRAYLELVRNIALQIKAKFFFSSLNRTQPATPKQQFILTAGGSIYFDVVTDIFGNATKDDPSLVTIIRSGAYLSHDHGFYHNLSPLGSSGSDGFTPATEVWAQVISNPEPGTVILNAGRRDLPYDQDLPVPLTLRTRGRFVDTVGWKLRELNDHHAIITTPTDVQPAIGDHVRIGTSHPCSLHDRWPNALIVDNAYNVIGQSQSFF